jgi:Ankyrin repeats (many copies)/Ankyrin repeat
MTTVVAVPAMKMDAWNEDESAMRYGVDPASLETDDEDQDMDDDVSVDSMDRSVTLVSPAVILKYRSSKHGSSPNLIGEDDVEVDQLIKERRQRDSKSQNALARSASTSNLTDSSFTIVQTVSSPTKTVQNVLTQMHPKASINPNETLAKLLREAGIPTTSVSFQNLPPRFVCNWTMSDVQSYSDCAPVATAIRSGNLRAIELAVSESPTLNLNACNKFGERLLHTAARRQQADILKYLILDQRVATRVICECGRTPLHDACWTMRPNFEVIRILLRAVPDYLRIADNRGFTPLQYIPRDTWGVWNDFLEQNPRLVVPKRLLS